VLNDLVDCLVLLARGDVLTPRTPSEEQRDAHVELAQLDGSACVRVVAEPPPHDKACGHSPLFSVRWVLLLRKALNFNTKNRRSMSRGKPIKVRADLSAISALGICTLTFGMLSFATLAGVSVRAKVAARRLAA
jgi:hypothetical protein